MNDRLRARRNEKRITRMRRDAEDRAQIREAGRVASRFAELTAGIDLGCAR